MQSDCNVEFSCHPEHEGVFPHPAPAAKMMPEYYKQLSARIDQNQPASTTAKRCVPFLEALSAGFVIPLWADLHVMVDDNGVTMSFPKNMPMSQSISGHSAAQIGDHPLAGEVKANHAFKVASPWIVTTPSGWSCLFTSPLNHLEARYKLFDGVVDTDSYYNQVNFPFMWLGRENGSFLIKRGTPFVQVIPFKRSTVTMSVGVTDVIANKRVHGVLGTRMADGYRQEYWHKRGEVSS